MLGEYEVFCILLALSGMAVNLILHYQSKGWIMSIKQNIAYTTAKAGLSSANRNNPFWSQRQAMGLLNLIRENSKKV